MSVAIEQWTLPAGPRRSSRFLSLPAGSASLVLEAVEWMAFGSSERRRTR